MESEPRMELSPSGGSCHHRQDLGGTAGFRLGAARWCDLGTSTRLQDTQAGALAIPTYLIHVFSSSETVPMCNIHIEECTLQHTKAKSALTRSRQLQEFSLTESTCVKKQNIPRAPKAPAVLPSRYLFPPPKGIHYPDL